MHRWVCDFPLHSQALLTQILSRDEYEGWLLSAYRAAEALQDWRVAARHLGVMGHVNVRAGDGRTALNYFERQATTARQAQALELEAEALMDAGVVCGALGSVGQAEQHWQEAWALFDQIHDPRASRIQSWLRELQSKSRPR